MIRPSIAAISKQVLGDRSGLVELSIAHSDGSNCNSAEDRYNYRVQGHYAPFRDNNYNLKIAQC